jgi:hypothetical protein
MAVPGIPTPHFNWGNELVPMNARGSTRNDPPDLKNSIESTYVHYNDYYLSELSQNVVIRCGPKAVHVESVLSEPVQVDGSASWSEFLQPFIESLSGGSGIVTLADFFGRIQGNGLRQPWMSRKIWQGSTPLRLSLNLKFLATGGTSMRGDLEEHLREPGFYEVYQPTCQLMSLVYPGGSGDGKNITHFTPPGPSAFHAFEGGDAMRGQQGKLGVVGHPVDVRVGNFILFQNCFVTNCSVRYSSTLDAGGYPMSATAALAIESYEYPFVDLAAASAIQSKKGSLPDAIAPPFTLFKLNQQTNDMAQKIANTLVDMANIFETVVRESGRALVEAVKNRTNE